MQLYDDLDPDLAPESPEPGRDRRCTPAKLEAWLRQFVAGAQKWPTLAEVKAEFGGLLGPLVDGWELERRGVLKAIRALVPEEK